MLKPRGVAQKKSHHKKKVIHSRHWHKLYHSITYVLHYTTKTLHKHLPNEHIEQEWQISYVLKNQLKPIVKDLDFFVWKKKIIIIKISQIWEYRNESRHQRKEVKEQDNSNPKHSNVHAHKPYIGFAT